MKQFNVYISIVFLLTILVIPSVVLAAWWNPFSWSIWQNIWNSIFYKQISAECTTAKDCQDIYKNCYYFCSSNKCAQIQTFVALKPYPDCSSSVSQPYINMLSPNGSESWKIGSTQTISWSSDNAPNGSWVALFLTEGPFIAQGLSVKGSYLWKVPTEYCAGDVCGFKLLTGNNYKIEARLYMGPLICLGLCPPATIQPTLLSNDYSDAPFSIQGSASTSFCGSSTYGTCSSNSDCILGGCSGEICQSKNENGVVSACMYRDCYNVETYGVSCGCTQGKCQWKN